MRALVLALSIAIGSVSGLAANPGTIDPAPAGAVSGEAAVASASIAALRSRGPAGLNLLLDTYAADIARIQRGETPPENWERLRAALDAVAGQRDAYASGLYWYTDLDAALAASKESGRPVLSLRLLGRLDEEFSCANSRFFRTALYANPRVAEFLRSNFVLHWSSERPAPKITIDFGDGRTLVRTITGNSAHYVLDVRGRVVDVLPGLYGPEAFVRELGPAIVQAKSVASADLPAWIASQHQYVARQVGEARSEWSSAIETLGGPGPAPKPVRTRTKAKDRPAAPSAGVAMTAAVTKSLVEVRVLEIMDLVTEPRLRRFDDPIWTSIASLRRADATLDAAGLGMVRRHVPAGTSEDDIASIVASFEAAMAVDTVRARFAIRPDILMRLDALWSETWDARFVYFDAFNRLVYDGVFMTPASDPWLGLYPASLYTALENGGVQ
jgi:hypothetical protein